jgi:hypothetical protein
MTNYSELIKRLRERPHRRAHETTVESQERRQKEREDAADALEAQAKRIAELDKAAKDAIKEVSYWSTETGKRDARIAELEAALKRVLDDIEDYERVNNLSPSPGKQDCWESVSTARAALKGEK